MNDSISLPIRYVWRTLSFGLLLVVALTGCDTVSNSMDPAAEVSSAAAANLVADLELDERQVAALEPTLRSLDGGEPGALWATAAAFQESLTDAQKARLLERQTAVRERMRDGDGPRRRGGRDSSFIADLTDEQRAALREIRTAHAEDIKALVEQRRAGTIEQAAFEEQMTAIRIQIRQKMEAVLTPEQLEAMPTPREGRRGPAGERQRQGRRGLRDRGEVGDAAMPQAMIDALALTDEQVTQLRALREAQREAMQTRQRDPSGDRDAARERMEAMRASLGEILTDAQRETVAIHRALVMTVRRAGKGPADTRNAK